MPTEFEKPHRHIGEGVRITYLPLIWCAMLIVLLILEAFYFPSLIDLTVGALIASIVISAMFIALYFFVKSTSPRANFGTKWFTLARVTPIPLASQAALSLDQAVAVSDPTATEEEIREALHRVPGTNAAGNHVSRAAVPLGGWSNDFISSPFPWEDGCFIYDGEAPFFRIGYNVYSFFEAEYRSQSEFSTRTLHELNTPKEGHMPGGFKLGPDGTPMLTKGRPFPEAIDYLRNSVWVHTIVLNKIGIGEGAGENGLARLMAADIEREFKARGLPIANDERTRNAVLSLIGTYLKNHEGLKFLKGQNFAGIEYYRTQNFALQQEVNRLEGNVGRTKRANWELMGGITGNQMKVAHQAAKGRVPEEPYEEVVLDKSRAGSRRE